MINTTAAVAVVETNTVVVMTTVMVVVETNTVVVKTTMAATTPMKDTAMMMGTVTGTTKDMAMTDAAITTMMSTMNTDMVGMIMATTDTTTVTRAQDEAQTDTRRTLLMSMPSTARR